MQQVLVRRVRRVLVPLGLQVLQALTAPLGPQAQPVQAQPVLLAPRAQEYLVQRVQQVQELLAPRARQVRLALTEQVVLLELPALALRVSQGQPEPQA